MWRSRLALIIWPLLAALMVGPPPPADVRPAVALEVRISGADYLPPGPDTQALRLAVRDTLRAILGVEFGFVNWNPQTAQPETLIVTVFKPDTGMVHACLRLELRGTVIAPDTAACPLEFESWSRIIKRDDWSPAAVRRDWGHVFDSLFAVQRDRLLKARLGKLPLNAAVDLDRDHLEAAVGVSPAQIGAAADSQDIEFRIATVWHDPDVAHPTRDPNAELWLKNCVPPDVGDGLVCDIDTLLYRGRPLVASANQALLLRARLDPFSVFLAHYRPATFRDVNDKGLTDAGGTP
jgi:hypothetical protein